MATTLPPFFVPGFHDENTVSRIPYTKLGSTGLIVSKLGFGCGSLGSGSRVNRETNEVISGHEEAVESVISAIKSGINYIDTAPLYCAGRSEIVLGHAVKQVPRSCFVLATKVGRTSNCTFDYTSQGVINSFQSSLCKLGVNYIDVIQVHDVEFAPSVDVIVNETLPTLDALKKEGKVGLIGVTGYPLSTLKEVIQRSTVKIDLVLSYCRQTLFDQELQSYLPFFRSTGLGVINAAVHGMGLLVGGSGIDLPEWHPSKEQVRSFSSSATVLCNQQGVDIARLALFEAIHGLGTSDIDTTLVGMSTRDVVMKNLHVLINGINEKEKTVLNQVKEYMKGLTERNWEGVELERVKKNPNEFNEKLYQLHSTS